MKRLLFVRVFLLFHLRCWYEIKAEALYMWKSVRCRKKRPKICLVHQVVFCSLLYSSIKLSGIFAISVPGLLIQFFKQLARNPPRKSVTTGKRNIHSRAIFWEKLRKLRDWKIYYFLGAYICLKMKKSLAFGWYLLPNMEQYGDIFSTWFQLQYCISFDRGITMFHFVRSISFVMR